MPRLFTKQVNLLEVVSQIADKKAVLNQAGDDGGHHAPSQACAYDVYLHQRRRKIQLALSSNGDEPHKVDVEEPKNHTNS